MKTIKETLDEYKRILGVTFFIGLLPYLAGFVSMVAKHWFRAAVFYELMIFILTVGLTVLYMKVTTYSDEYNEYNEYKRILKGTFTIGLLSYLVGFMFMVANQWYWAATLFELTILILTVGATVLAVLIW